MAASRGEPRPTARDCLTFEERPSTPPDVRKYRRSTYLEPGQRFQHYGIVEDLKSMDLDKKIYGVSSDSGNGTAAELLSHKKLTDIEKINMIRAEKVYKGSAREPLGKTVDRHIQLPSKFTEGKEAFGVKSKSSAEPAKDIIFPTLSEDSIRNENLYKKSHGSFAPGEQKRRDYDWNIDPVTTVFGAKGDTIALNGVSKNIAEVLKPNTDDEPVVISKRVEDFRNTNYTIGQSRNLGQNSANRPFDMVYGKPSAAFVKTRSKTQLSAAEVLKGRYSLEDQMPDVDLGKSITPGFRNISLEDRAFGVPSIRTDLPAKPINRRSIADSQNYGDDVPAQDLINPPAFSDLAISHDSLSELKPKDKILYTFKRIGYDLDSKITDIIFRNANKGFPEGMATINSYRDALNEYLEAVDCGNEADWMRYYGLSV